MRFQSPGWKSTEFWVTIASVALKLFVPDFPDEALMATGAYVVSRGVAKVRTPTADENPERVEIVKVPAEPPMKTRATD